MWVEITFDNTIVDILQTRIPAIFDDHPRSRFSTWSPTTTPQTTMARVITRASRSQPPAQSRSSSYDHLSPDSICNLKHNVQKALAEVERYEDVTKCSEDIPMFGFAVKALENAVVRSLLSYSIETTFPKADLGYRCRIVNWSPMLNRTTLPSTNRMRSSGLF